MSNPTLRRAIDLLVDMALEEAGKPKPHWDGFAVRAIAQLPENYQREIFASDEHRLRASVRDGGRQADKGGLQRAAELGPNMNIETSSPLSEPEPVAPVRLRGRMTPNGYQSENHAWWKFLTRPDPSLGERHDGSPRLAGRDPMKILPATLTKAGHPPRRTSALVSALGNPGGRQAGNEDGDPMGPLECIKGYRDIPAYCDACAGTAQSRRRCACIDCPFWAYRMGRNPHNPRSGKAPVRAAQKCRG